MLLAIDVGNTNTVLGLYRLPTAADPGPASLVADWRVTTSRHLTVDEVGIIFRDLFNLRQFDISQVTGVVVSSVVPPLDTTIRRAAELYCKVRPVFVEPGTRTGLPILTDNPAEVGADRIVNCVAAIDLIRTEQAAKSAAAATVADATKSPNIANVPNGANAPNATKTPSGTNVPNGTHVPIIIVDFGTATTFDCVSRRGEYVGGAIAPGLGISADALFVRAARLPRVDIRKPAKIIGTNTVDHLQIGLYYGYIGLVDGILARMTAELGSDTRTIATGGLAKLIAGGSRYISQVDEYLTLTGLRLIYERNQDHRDHHHGRQRLQKT